MRTGGTALVTGAAGFIGSHLVTRLAETGVRVRALDVKAPSSPFEHPGVETHRTDIRDRGLVRELLEGVDVAFHLASIHLEVHAAEEEFRQVNVEAVADLVRACADAGVRRLVHTSSVGIFGHVEDPPAGEDAPKRPMTAYERTKLAGETSALEAARGTGLDLVVVRPAWVYGPGCPRTRKLLEAIRTRRFFYVGGGQNLRHPVYVQDTVDGLLSAADADPARAAGRTFILAGPRAMTLREMVETGARVLGVSPPWIRVPRPLFQAMAIGAEAAFLPLGRPPPFSRRTLSFFSNDNAFLTSEAKERLGFRAGIDFESGLRATIAAERASEDAGSPGLPG